MLPLAAVDARRLLVYWQAGLGRPLVVGASLPACALLPSAGRACDADLVCCAPVYWNAALPVRRALRSVWRLLKAAPRRNDKQGKAQPVRLGQAVRDVEWLQPEKLQPSPAGRGSAAAAAAAAGAGEGSGGCGPGAHRCERSQEQ